MAISLVVNGVSYSYPQAGDLSWENGTTGPTEWALAVTNGMLQKAGGTFTLTGDANFGPNFGLISKYFTSQASNPASTGVFRLASGDSLSFRNNANSGDIALAKNASDQLTWAGTAFLSSSGQLLSSGFPNLTGDVTSSGFATTVAKIQGTSVSGTTGTGNVVFSSSPTLTTPTIAALINAANVFSIEDSTDNTKVIAFNASGNTTAKTLTLSSAVTLSRTLTFPDATDTLTANAATQTLTNKTLTGNTIASFTPDGSHTLTAPTVTDTLAVLAASQTLTNKTINGSNNTITNVSLTAGVTGVLPVANGGTNSGTTLNNNRVIVSSGSALVEASAITASRALVSDTNGLPTASVTTTTELSYVSGVTSAIQTQLNNISATTVPPGAVFEYAGQTAPTGYFICDGTAQSRTTYSLLFAAIGCSYGIGDGSTTFNLPDMRGRFARGWDNAAGRDPNSSTRTAAVAGTFTVTSGVTNGTTTITYAATSNVAPGMTITGTNIQANTVIASVQSTTQATLSLAASGSGSGITFTLSKSATGNYVGSVQAGATALPGTSFTTGTESATHTHNFSQSGTVLQSGSGGAAVNSFSSGSTVTTTADSNNHTHTVTGGGDSETRPLNIFLNYIIKT